MKIGQEKFEKKNGAENGQSVVAPKFEFDQLPCLCPFIGLYLVWQMGKVNSSAIDNEEKAIRCTHAYKIDRHSCNWLVLGTHIRFLSVFGSGDRGSIAASAT